MTNVEATGEPVDRTHPVRDRLATPRKQCEKDAPLSGPAFPAPSHLHPGSGPLQAAIEKFEAYLHDLTQELAPTSGEQDLKPAAGAIKTLKNAAFAVSLFSTRDHEDVTLYEKYHTPPVDVGVKQVDRDSVFRIASISKVVTVWAFLIAAGDGYFNDSVTKHVPELAELVSKRRSRTNDDDDSIAYDDIDEVRWEDVTLGQLAGHGAGIARDLTWGDFSLRPREERQKLNLPDIDPADIPSPENPDTIREDFFSYLSRQHPHFPPAHSPVYSNIAYLLLSYALESITGRDLATIVKTQIFEPLGMSRSSYETPIEPGGVVPVAGDKDPASDDVMWTAASLPAMDHPGGANYMSTGDLVRAGRAILQSTLLPPGQTRRWLQPTMLTGDPTSHIGAPWEIRCERAPNNRIYEYYTKAGDVGAYASMLVLSPQHQVGWTVLAASGCGGHEEAAEARTALTNAFQTFFVDAIEEQAKIEAEWNFNGTYVDRALESSVTIEAGYDGHMGLAALDLMFRGKPFDCLAPLDGFPEERKADITLLYPSTLKTLRKKKSDDRSVGLEGEPGYYESRLGFRAVFWGAGDSGTLAEDPSMTVWGTVGHVKYGQRTLDDWVFEMDEDGRAVALHLRALRVKLQRGG